MIFKNIGWASLQSIGLQFSTGLVFLISARIVGSELIGAYAFANLFFLLGQVLVGQGFPEGMIQSVELNKRHINTIFWYFMVIGSCVSTALLIAGIVFSGIENKRDFGLILVSMSPLVALRSVAQVQNALGARLMKYQQLAKASLMSTIVADLLALVLLFNNFSIWSVVIGQYIKVALLIILMKSFANWEVVLEFDWAVINRIHAFSKSVFATHIMSFLAMRLDQFLIGTLLGFEALGIYSIAKRIIQLLEGLLINSVRTVLFSVFSRLQSDLKRSIKIFLSALNLLCAISFPVYIAVILLAPSIIHILLGDGWHASGNVLSILCISTIINTIGYLFYPLQLGLGQSRIVLQVAIFNAAITAVCISVTAAIGIYSVAASFILVSVCVLIFNYFLVTKVVAIPTREFLKILINNITPMLVALFIGYWSREIVWGAIDNSLITIAATTPIVFSVYVGLIYLFNSQSILTDYKIVKNLRINP